MRAATATINCKTTKTTTIPAVKQRRQLAHSFSLA